MSLKMVTSFRAGLISSLIAALTLLNPQTSLAQGALTNGLSHAGSISGVGEVDSWSATLARGDRFVVQISELSGGANFTPRIEVLSPDGTPLGASSGGVAARLDLQAPFSGSYTVAVSDLARTGAGTYRLQMAAVPGVFAVAAGDEGGALTNGANQLAVIDVGDLDLWSFAANPGDRIVLQVGEVTGGASFTPLIELFAPDGVRVASTFGSQAARLDAQAETAGTYTVIVSDANATGAGSYELHLVQVPESFTVPAGDEGGALTDGANADGTIGLGDLDRWTFAASSGDRVTLQITELTGGAGFTPLLELFDPRGERRRFLQNASAATLELAIDTAGTYSVLVSDANQTGVGTYRLVLTRGTIGAAGSNVLVNGQTSLGAISTVGGSNLWTFTATAGDNIVVRIGETTTTAFIPWLRLSGPNGLLLGSDFNATAAEVSIRATNSGTFVVAVADGTSGRNQIGSYQLSLAKTGSALSIAAGDEGGGLTNGVSYLASIDVGDIDAWTFTANAGESIALWMGEVTAGATLLPWLRLYGPEGVLLAADFNAAAAEVTVRATNSGTFLVVVGDGNNALGGFGTYRLSLAKTGSPLAISSLDEGGALTNGASYLAAIDTGDVDVWTFIANAGESVVVRAGETVTSSLNPWVRLFGPNGALLNDDFNAGAAEVTARATNSGTFTVLIADGTGGRGNSGNYRLSLAKTGAPLLISPLDEGGALSNGTTYTAAIETGDIDAWTFTASAGENILVRMGETVPGAFLPWLRLYGPNGVLLDADFNAAAAEVGARATNNGSFLVVVGDGSSGIGASGNYRLSLAKTGSPLIISPQDEGADLVNGTTYTAAIETGDLDAWTFSASTGDSIIVRAGETTAGGLLPWLRLYGPNGVLLASDFNAAAAEVAARATNSGVFQVVFADGNSGIGASGDYRISLAKTGEPLTISSGDEGGGLTVSNSYDGMLEVGDMDAWTFTACAGDAISLRLDEAVANSSLTPWIRLYGRDGTLLNSNFGAARGEIIRTAPANGTYLLLVADGTSGIGGSGTYRLTAQGLVTGVKMCVPLRLGAAFRFQGAGGFPNTSFVVLTTTNIATPVESWVPVLTNNFGSFGEFNFTNAINPSLPQQFFQLRAP